MEKLASDAKLDTPSRLKTASFAFATALASPVLNLDPEKVKAAAKAYHAGLQKVQERHSKLVDMLTAHVNSAQRA